MADIIEKMDWEESSVVTEGETSGGPLGSYKVKEAHSSGFKDFLLKPELLRAIVDCGFEQPSEGNVSLWNCTSPAKPIGVFKDECDKLLEQLDMTQDVQYILKKRKKQLMMFTSNLTKDIRPVCRKFLRDSLELYIAGKVNRCLQGLQHHYVTVQENEKKEKLCNLLDVLKFNQVAIFVNSVQQCITLWQFLIERKYPTIALHTSMTQEEQSTQHQQLDGARVLVATDMFGLNLATERVDIILNFDMPEEAEIYLCDE